ncbi:unnamed protein product [Cutaneotrichosporon oleaginosum]
MNPDGEGSRPRGAQTPSRRKPKKKPRPIPEPYIVTAPPSALRAAAPDDAGLVLPSTYLQSMRNAPASSSGRPSYAANFISPPTIMATPQAPRPPPSPGPSRGYAANLLSPPAIMPGGRAGEPLQQGQGRSTPQRGRLGSHAHASQANLRPASPNLHPERPTTPTRRPRRRVVQESIRRRQRSDTVNSVEEGRAIGLARGASMRRVNLWDGIPAATSSTPSHLPPEPPAATGSASRRTLPTPPEVATPSSEHSSSSDEVEADDRADRRQWNADILAGYTLAERVAREAARLEARTPRLDSPRNEADARRREADEERRREEEQREEERRREEGRRRDEERRREEERRQEERRRRDEEERRRQEDARRAAAEMAERETREADAWRAAEEAARREAEAVARRAEAEAIRQAEAEAQRRRQEDIARQRRQDEEAARLRRRQEEDDARRAAMAEEERRAAIAATLRQAQDEARQRVLRAEEELRRIAAHEAAARDKQEAEAKARRAETAAAATRRHEVDAALREVANTHPVSAPDFDAARHEVMQRLGGRETPRAEIVAAAKEALTKKARLATTQPEEGLQPTLPAQWFHGGLIRSEEPGVVYDLVPAARPKSRSPGHPAANPPITTTPPRSASTSPRALVTPTRPLFSSPAQPYTHRVQPSTEMLESPPHSQRPKEEGLALSGLAMPNQSGHIPQQDHPPSLPSRPPEEYVSEYRPPVEPTRLSSTEAVAPPGPTESPRPIFTPVLSTAPSAFSSSPASPSLDGYPRRRTTSSSSSGPRPQIQSRSSSGSAAVKSGRRLSGPRSQPSQERVPSIPPVHAASMSPALRAASTGASSLDVIVASGPPSRVTTPVPPLAGQRSATAQEASPAAASTAISSSRADSAPAPRASSTAESATSPRPYERRPTQSRRQSSIVSTDSHTTRSRSSSVSGPRAMPKSCKSSGSDSMTNNIPPVPAIPPQHTTESGAAAALQAYKFPAEQTEQAPQTRHPRLQLGSEANVSSRHETSPIRPPKRSDSLSASDTSGHLRRSSQPSGWMPSRSPGHRAQSNPSLDSRSTSTVPPLSSSSSRTQSPVVSVSQTPPLLQRMEHAHAHTNSDEVGPPVPPKDETSVGNGRPTASALSSAPGVTHQSQSQYVRRETNEPREESGHFQRLSVALGRDSRYDLLKHVLGPTDEQGRASQRNQAPPHAASAEILQELDPLVDKGKRPANGERPMTQELSGLMASSSALLAFLEEGAESSSQAAAKGQARRALAAELEQQHEIERRIHERSAPDLGLDHAIALALQEADHPNTVNDEALAAALQADSEQSREPQAAPQPRWKEDWPTLPSKGKERAPPPKPKRPPPPPPPRHMQDASASVQKSSLETGNGGALPEPVQSERERVPPHKRDTQYMIASFPIPPVPSGSNVPTPPAPQLPPITPSRPLSQFPPARPESQFIIPSDAPPLPSQPVPPLPAQLPTPVAAQVPWPMTFTHPARPASRPVPPPPPSALASRRPPPPPPARQGAEQDPPQPQIAPLIELDDKAISQRPSHLRHQPLHSISSSSSSLLDDPRQDQEVNGPVLAPLHAAHRPRPRGRRDPPPVPPRPWARVVGEESSTQEMSTGPAVTSRPEAEQDSRRGSTAETHLQRNSTADPDAHHTSAAADQGHNRLSVHRPSLLRTGSSSSSMFAGLRLDAHGRLIEEDRPTSRLAENAAPPAAQSESSETRRVSEPWLDVTDVELYASRVIDGANEYEGLNHIIDFLGPAKEPGATPDELATLVPAPVVVDSRRVNAAGKVKIKLSVLGVRVTNCPVCLAQYRGDDAAVLLPCGHISHESCARRWLRESNACMVCRKRLIDDGGSGSRQA